MDNLMVSILYNLVLYRLKSERSQTWNHPSCRIHWRRSHTEGHRYPIRLQEPPANDTCYRGIFKRLHSTVLELRSADHFLELDAESHSRPVVAVVWYWQVVQHLPAINVSNCSSSELLWNRYKTLTEITRITYATARVNSYCKSHI